MRAGRKRNYAHQVGYSLVAVFADRTYFFPQCVRSNRYWHFRKLRPSTAARLRAADLTRRGLHLDARLLGLRSPLWLLLGAWDVDYGSAGWLSVDTRILGLGRRRLLFP